ncbi:hypothetical protein [Streptomyces echinatus]|uniref:Uncharacterized protein n=1 Tax=Streptomyces echinatus TaxID=67293 RepID=A0A7W9PXK6_9ACTN|nr:hypothetical protein [Streptomyces echinatus]MBB5929248.1 hypothetical protein [Streptomyces echinatus]
MNGNQIEGLIGILATLGILVLLILPSALGAVRDRRVDRQLREAERPATPPRAGAKEEPERLGRRSGVARHA